ncbi:MAG: sensor histidine kinase [Candidatus Binatia bacterium]
MTFRQQQIAVFLGTVVVIFSLLASGLLLIAKRLTTEATMQTALLLARQVEIALADSLSKRPDQATPRAQQISPWNFLGRLFPGKPVAKSTDSSQGTAVKGLMRAYLDRSASIEAMWVLNADGKVLYASRSGDEKKAMADPAMQENLRNGITTIVPRREGKQTYYDVLVPLQMPKGVRGPGGLRLWMDPADLTELLAGMGRQLTLLFVLAGFVALGSALLTTTLYTRRFRLISDTLREAEAGTYQARPRYPKRDEVGASLDLIDRLVMRQRGAKEGSAPLQRLAVAARTLAHEVRTPLNAMAVHLELLRQSPGEEKPSDGREKRTLETLEAGVRQVERLIHDFTDYTGPVTLQHNPVDVAQVLAASLEASGAQCSARGISLTKQLPPGPWRLHGDATRLRQAFDNLLRNAMEAQRTGGAIRVSGERNGARLTLCFSDTGPGIPPEQRAKLFDFGHSTKPGGSGIGLPLSQLIVEAHGGTLEYDDTAGATGATFRLTLQLDGRA